MFKVSPVSLQTFVATRLTLTPSVILNYNYLITEVIETIYNTFALFFYCNHQVHREV
jgi:hypothetical protein